MNLKVNEKDEVVDVCKAWEEQKEWGKMEMLYSLVQDGTLKADKAADKANLTVTQEEAKRMLEVSEEDIIMAEKRISEIHQTICV